jgi:mitochondrial fission protein ELM1
MPTVYARTLRRAADIVGGAQALARDLEVSPAIFRGWLDGSANPPMDIFLKAVDIVVAHDAVPPTVSQGTEQ